MFAETVHRQLAIHEKRFEFWPTPAIGNPGNRGSYVFSVSGVDRYCWK